MRSEVRSTWWTGIRAAGTRAVMLGFALLLMTALAACKTPDPERVDGQVPVSEKPLFPVVVKDDAGRSVTIPEKPDRIVSLAPANTEIVAALGLESMLVGVTTYCDYPESVKDLPKVGDFATPNIEAISAAKPDIILATTGVQADVIAQLEGLGATVLAIDPQNLKGVMSAIKTVASATGVPEKGDELVEDMTLSLEEVRAAVAETSAVPCFIEIAQNPLYTAGAGTLIDDLIIAAGGKNIVAEKGYVGYSLEKLVELDPAVYLATKGSMSDPADLAKRQGYSSLAAVKGGRVYVLEDNLVSRPGPRVIEGVRQIVDALHPGALDSGK